MTFTTRPTIDVSADPLAGMRIGDAPARPVKLGQAPHVSVGFTDDLQSLPGQKSGMGGGWAPGGFESSFAGAAVPQYSAGSGIGALNLRAGANQRKIAAAIEDEVAAKQWHLGYLGDMVKLWQDYDGTGVSFGVYDSGIDKRVADVNARYDASKEVVVGGRKYNGDYTPISGPHGTAVAGLIAAARDGENTIGVAYNASITGVNIFDPYSGGGRKQGIYVNASNNAAFFEAVNQFGKFDVVNNSWGPGEPSHGPNDNRLYEGSFAYGMSLAYEKAAAEGRGGLGTVVVNAAGNYGMVINNANLLFGVDGSVDSASTGRHIIAVGAYRQIDGSASSYSTRGAHLLISAPSNDYAELGGSGIWAADLKGKEGYNTLDDPSGALDYTDSFGGTSAAAPILSGVVGLMLDANAGLGWRDVKDILAASAVMPVKFETGQTSLEYNGNTYYLNEDRFRLTGDGSAARINGGGYHFSTDYGYGAVDAFSAVRMAEVWSLFGPAKTSANEKTISAGSAYNRVIPDSRYSGANTLTTPTSFAINVRQGVDIEHLDLKFTYTTQANGFDDYDYSASFRITVKSPDGTSYKVSLAGLGSVYGENNTLITEAIGLAGFRGESSLGRWTITFEDIAPGGVSILKDLRLEFSGSELTTNNVYHYTQEFLTMAAIKGQSARTQIDDKNGGEDWLNMAAITDKIELNLSGGAIYFGDPGFGDKPGTMTLMNANIENVIAGDGTDRLTGSAVANKMYGMRGNDWISGMDGDDWISGGQGDDYLDGGNGRDTFFFSMAERTGQDRITNFTAEDRLAFDAKLADANNDGKIELKVYEKFGVESVLRLDNVTAGDRISFDSKITAIYLIEQKDGIYYYGLTKAKAASAGSSTVDVHSVPFADFGGSDTKPVFWTDSFGADQHSLFGQ